MIVYNYDRYTSEYTGQGDADLDVIATRREGKEIYVLPVYSTFEKPPVTSNLKVAVYNNGWVVKDDFRGMYKVNETMRPQKITTIGSVTQGYIVITEEQAAKIFEDDLYYIYTPNGIALNPDYEELTLERAKEIKLAEALSKAKSFIENEACFRFDENNTIEATDGNIGKLTAYALGFQSGQFNEVVWTSKEDNVLTLNQEDLLTVLTGLGAVQSNVWNVQYIAYKNLIEQAETIESVNIIEIVYSMGE